MRDEEKIELLDDIVYALDQTTKVLLIASACGLLLLLIL